MSICEKPNYLMIKETTEGVYNNKTILSICDEFIHLNLLQ